MAATRVTKQTAATMNAGKAPTMSAADGENGNDVLADSENLHLVVLNTDSSTHTVTITRPKVSNVGSVVPVGPITVAAAVAGKPGVWLSSILPLEWFKSADATPVINIAWDATPTGVYFAVVEMTPAPSAV
jgi:hypothetical protein